MYQIGHSLLQLDGDLMSLPESNSVQEEDTDVEMHWTDVQKKEVVTGPFHLHLGAHAGITWDGILTDVGGTQNLE